MFSDQSISLFERYLFSRPPIPFRERRFWRSHCFTVATWLSGPQALTLGDHLGLARRSINDLVYFWIDFVMGRPLRDLWQIANARSYSALMPQDLDFDLFLAALRSISIGIILAALRSISISINTYVSLVS